MKYKFFLLIFFVTFLYIYANAQTCTMNISTLKVCLGNPVSFSLTITGGTGTPSYTWNFGNSNTNNQSSPLYQYPSTGTFTPSVTVTFSGGGSCSTTGLPITVFPLPNANIQFTTSSTQCFYNNQICIKNISTKSSSNAPLDSGDLNWDDGTKITFTPVFGQIFCHTYIDPFGGIYSPVLNIYDTNGCIARIAKTDSLTVYPKMGLINFSATYTPSCPQTSTLFRNLSTIPKTMVKSFQWNFGDGSIDSTHWDNFSHTYTNVGSFSAILNVIDINGCAADTQILSCTNYHLDPTIYLWPGNHECYMGYKQTKPDSTFLNYFTFTSHNVGALLGWALYDPSGKRMDTTNNFPGMYPVGYSFPTCGTYRLRMSVYYPNSGCISTTDTVIDIYGPKAIIQNDSQRVVNQSQCQIHDTVLFRTPVPYLNCHNDNISMFRIWNFGDVNAPQCTTDTKHNINVNTNCNWSLDSMNVRHYYLQGKEGCYYATLFMIDTARLCVSADTITLKLTSPNAGWDSTKIPIRQGVYYRPPQACMYDPITFYFDQVLPTCGFDTAWLMPDSACKNTGWIKLPPKTIKQGYTYTKTCDTTSNGWITYGVIISNGTNDNGNICYDTAWYHYKIHILPINPNFTVTVANKCAPYLISAKLVDSIQNDIIKASWYFSTISNYLPAYQIGSIAKQQSITQVLNSPADSIIHSQMYLAPMGPTLISLTLTNTDSCVRTYQYWVYPGFLKDAAASKYQACVGDTITLFEYVRYFNSNYPYWEDKIRAAANLEKLWWDIGDSNGFSITGSNPTIQYTKPGIYSLRLLIQDSLGCTDTVNLIEPITVSSVDAQMKTFKTIQYCAPFLLDLVDSSIVKGNDNIVSWEWKFTDNTPRSLLQDPQHEFTFNGTFNIFLTVKTNIGCVDTISKNITIIGPTPSFNIISDTVGCSPFTAKFQNTTIGQLLWQWNFMDQNKTTLYTNQDTDVTFSYTTPGIYYIRLLGVDTIIDPSTNTRKTCYAYFPDTTTNIPVREVRVLISAKANIIATDSICPNIVDTFIARCDTAFKNFMWNFGDGDTASSKLPDSTISHFYIKSGLYKVSLLPVSPDPKSCVDTAYKNIFVNDIKAMFTIDASQSPLYQFKNSSLYAVNYKWYIGKDETNLFSIDANPSKDFTDTVTIIICLEAFNQEGCWDSICKDILMKSHLFIPNVFTPGNNDGLNDAFDIDIAGNTKYNLIIYNRWGTEVYISDRDGIGNDGINWNGRDHNTGAQCSSGTYFFIFNYRMLTDANDKSVHGTITLIRP